MNENCHLHVDKTDTGVKVRVCGTTLDVLAMEAYLLNSLLDHGVSWADLAAMVLTVCDEREASDASAGGSHDGTCSEAYKAKIAAINNTVSV